MNDSLENNNPKQMDVSRKADKLDSKAAEMVSKQLASESEQIIEEARKIRVGASLPEGVRIWNAESGNLEYSLTGERVKKLGVSGINLGHFRPPMPSSPGTTEYYLAGNVPYWIYARAQGVETQTSLEVKGVHMDESTKQLVDSLTESDPNVVRGLKTVYFFDQQGNYGKLVNVPRKQEGFVMTADGRMKAEEVVTFELGPSAMTPEDMELAGMSLKLLKDSLQEIKS
jgi:hypothetical protein